MSFDIDSVSILDINGTEYACCSYQMWAINCLYADLSENKASL